MNNRQDNSPTYDYEELLRQHAQYKERKRQEMLKKEAGNEPAAEPAKAPAKPVAAVEKVAEPAPEVAGPEINFSEEEPIEEMPEAFDADISETAFAGEEGEEYPEEYYEEDEGSAPASGKNPNPFDSFFNVFSKLRGKFSRKKADAYEDEAFTDYEEEFSDKNLPGADGMTAEYPEEDYAPAPAGDYADEPADYADEAPAPRRRFSFRKKAEKQPEEDYAAEDIADDLPSDTADIPEDSYAPVYSNGEGAYDEGYEDDGYTEESYEDYPDEDYGDEEDYAADAAAPKKIGKFGKFIRLFVVPVDEDEDASDDEDYYQAYDDGAYDEGAYESDNADADFYADYDEDAYSYTEQTRPGSEPAEDAIEGGLDNMADLNRINPELSKALAADLENKGMTRRERRELAERLAAEEAARKAAEAQAAAETAEASEPETAGPVVELFTEEALEADVVEDVSSGIVEIEETPSIDVSVVDEPTREFKPVSKMSFDEYMETVEEDEEEEEVEEEPVRKGLFGRRKAKKVVEEEEYDDEDEEDYEEEEEEEEEPVRKGLFGRRKARKVVEEEEYDDEDEEDYDEYDEYDDEEEEEPVKPSRRSRKNRYDDEDDYEEDYDDEEYDDYDEEEDYDDEEDDYDEGGSSFGRGLLRFLTVIISLVLILAIVLLSANILNVINVISLTPLAERMPEKVVDILLFSEETKQLISGEVADEPEVPAEPVAGADTIVVPEITLEDTQPEAETEPEVVEDASEPAVEADEEAAAPTVG